MFGVYERRFETEHPRTKLFNVSNNKKKNIFYTFHFLRDPELKKTQEGLDLPLSKEGGTRSPRPLR